MEWRGTREKMQYEFEAKIKAAIDMAAGESKGGKGGGEKRGGSRNLDAKTTAHLKDNKFSGKDGGVGWSIFLEDMLVVLGSVDSELEAAANEVTNLKEKGFDVDDGVKKNLDPEVYAKYTGELYARLMEVTKDDAQKLVRNCGMKELGKSRTRCGFRALRELAERYNPKTYMNHLKMLLGVIKPTEAKAMKDVRAAVDEWGGESAEA